MAALPLTNLQLALGVNGPDPHSTPYPFPFTRNQVFDEYTITPLATVGKVLATVANGGIVNCSGSAVSSPQGRLVVTAAHCISDGKGNFYTNIRFLPAYRDGVKPYGEWAACGRGVAAGWSPNSNPSNDIGVIVTCEQIVNGLITPLHAFTGALGYLANSSRNQNWNIFGYPKNSTTYSGERLYTCQSSHGADDSYYSTNPPMGAGCDLSSGMSGGPWIFDYGRNAPGSSNNQINGVSSYSKLNQQNAEYSPWFGNNFLDLYNAAVNGLGA